MPDAKREPQPPSRAAPTTRCACVRITCWHPAFDSARNWTGCTIQVSKPGLRCGLCEARNS